MANHNVPLRCFQSIQIGDSLRISTLGEEKVTAQISFARFKIICEKRVPAGSFRLQDKSLRCTRDLQVQAAQCAIFNDIQEFIDAGLAFSINERIEGSGVCLVVYDKQRVSSHEACRIKHIGPQPQHAVVFLKNYNGCFLQAIINEQAGIILAADAETIQIAFYTIQRLLIQCYIISCQQNECRESHISRFADNSEYLTGFAGLNVSKEQTNLMPDI